MAGKKYREASAQVDQSRAYSIDEAVELTKKVAFAKFDETVELGMTLGVDPRKADQLVRGTVVLPHGLGKSKRVIVICSAEKVQEARDAGADEVGGDDIVTRIKGGWVDFDALIATPDMMRSVGQLGKILGPRGLMPNPKTGTVTMDIAKAVADIKGGKVEYRADKTGNVHVVLGKKSFDERALFENYLAIVDEVLRAKPSAAKGRFVKSLAVSTTMGPSVRIDPVHPKGLDAAVV